MKNIILYILTKINFFYPNLLGGQFIRYNLFLKQNYSKYDNTEELIKRVNHARKYIKFYRKSISQPINSLEDFYKYVPIINKDVVMENWHDFVLPDLKPTKIVETTTGGTSGKPLRLIIPKNRHIVELNTIHSLWSKIGWKGQLRGVIRNHQLKDRQIFKINPFKKEVIFDGFRTDKSYYEGIYRTLIKYNIKYIHAYPSSAYQFSLFLKNERMDTTILKGFLCGSEGLTNLQHHLIVKDLGLSVYNWYGHSEKLILGGPCKNNNATHIEPTYGFFELLNEKGENITTIGEIGEIAGSTIHNSYMPLFRYKTGDYAEYAGNYCSYCKRHLPLVKNIQGRWDNNKIFLNDNSYVTITALNLHSELYNKIDGIQYVQNKVGSLDILLIKGENFSKQDALAFVRHFENALKNKCVFELIYTNKLQKEPNGKFLPLKQNIKK